MFKEEGFEHTLKRTWFGERGNVCFWNTRFPVKVYSELFGCSHCTSPAVTKGRLVGSFTQSCSKGGI